MRHGEPIVADAGITIPAGQTLQANGGVTIPDGALAVPDWHKSVAIFAGLHVAHVGTWSPTAAAGALNGGALWNTTAALNDSVSWDLILGAGTWTIGLVTSNQNNAGVLTAQIDGAAAGSVDMYTVSAQTYNHAAIFAGVSIAATGKHRVTLAVLSKNASSTGYNALIQALGLQRTA